MTNADVGHAGPGTTLIRLPGVGRWLAALAACLVVAGATLLGAGAARAATIDGAITSITTTATNTTQWDRVDLACTWAVPDGSSPGDTFSLQLPPQLRWFGSADFDLTAPDGQPVAHAHAGADGLVVFTLTDYVRTHPVDLHGTCHFSTRYSAETTDETVHLDFQVGDQVVRVDLPTVGPCTHDCAVDRTEASKYMWWDDTSQTTTQSVIRTPATTLAVSDVTITDAPGPGLALDCGSLTATIGKVLDADGNVTTPRDDAQYVPEISCTTHALSVTWSDVPAGEYAELWVRADVVDPSLATYGNDGSVTMDGRTTPVHDTVRHSDAGGDGEGTPSPTTTTSTSTTTSTTTTSPSSTTSPTSSSTTSSTTSPTTSPSTTATGTGTVTPPVTTGGVVVTTGSGTTGGALGQGLMDDTALAFTGFDAVQLAGVAAVLLGSGILLTGLGRRSRGH
ncbi:Ig-like domain-containing protein [Phycicoccus sp. Soil803]|uniref:Ig-like domain-containing protein n=1 Tax=Phycicoccus sp. Soil803 TaxID=1736415 RepID=UPI0007107837|nr:Ig-like domain-containing protein [Phycicoccus sp. Soil803]KRF25947.1 hypothetical protein ASG95_16825 [Phycicoccus sp. Soil803]